MRTLFQFYNPLRRQLVMIVNLSAFLILAGCSLSQAASRQPLDAPTLVPPSTASERAATSSETTDAGEVDNTLAMTGDQWLYTAEIVPVSEIIIATEVGGRIIKFDVKVGDSISAGQTLLGIDATVLEAQRGQALAALQSAQAEAELLQVRATEAEIEAARATTAAAQETYRQALEGPDEAALSAALSTLRQAEAALRIAQATYDQSSWNPLIAALPQNAELEQAKVALEAAQARYDALLNGTPEAQIAERYAQLASARKHLQRLENGPTEAEIQAAEAQVRLAETTLYLAQLALEKAVVAAPVDGIVAEVYVTVGATALPHAPALRLNSPNVKVVIAVEANRLAQLHIGQRARIQVTAYPSETFAGTITAIAPQIDAATGAARVTVEPADDNSSLKPGMVATVEILSE
jgi:multidrug efflux pump subunit AcrA (membrane-fusion protein)